VSDLEELEQRASRAPESVDPTVHARLAEHYWERTQKLEEYRAYRDALKRTMFFIEHAADHGFSDPERLRNLYDMVEGSWEENFLYRSSQLQLQAKLRARWVAGESNTGPELREQNDGDTVVQGRTLLLGDLGWQPDADHAASTPSEELLLEWMRDGNRFGWHTGGPDRRRPMNRYTELEIRYVDGDEPVLAPDELDSIYQCTSTLVVRAPTGRLAFGRVSAINPDPADDRPDDDPPESHRVTVDVPSDSHYRACIYYLTGPTRRLAIVAETSDTPPNDVETVSDTF
jgi:hypothetical protein